LHLIFYAIGACAWAAAVAVQLGFMSEAGLPLPTLMLKPWKAITVMADSQNAFAAPGQIRRLALFGLLLFVGFGALVAGRSVELGRPPF
jgi:hypothetical protein